MALFVSTRVMTKVGAHFVRMAKDLARSAYLTGSSTKYKIINGFLLRVSGRSSGDGDLNSRERGSYTATVMDLPGYIFFAGPTRLPGFSLTGLIVPAGIRDDFESPGSNATFEVLDKSSYYILPAASPRQPSPQENATDWQPTIQAQDWFLGYGRLSVPVLRAFPDQRNWYLDDESYFTYQTVVGLMGSIVSMFTAARSLTIQEGQITIGGFTPNYFLNNQYSISEGDLPGDWKLYPRRLVPLSQSGPGFTDRRYPGVTMNGYAIKPASTSTALEGIDRYCHAARTFKQFQQPWGDSGSQGFDRYGEQGMLIAVGEQDRSAFDPQTGRPVFANTSRMRVVVPENIAQTYLHPSPEILPGDESGKPDLPNFGTFYTPTPAQCGSEFAVFSAYTTFRNLGEGANNPTSGDLWSIVTALPGGQVISLRADWNAEQGEIPTGVPGEFMQPWIVGATHIPQDDEVSTAYCLVWEQTYGRKSTTPIKGEWALYVSSGGNPTRTTISGGAPLFSALMKSGPTLFGTASYDVSNPMSSVYYAGNNKLVTAAIDYPPASGSRSVRCAVFDVATRSVSLGGQIAATNDDLEKCLITVVQPFIASAGSSPAVPAVLLATITRNVVGNNGAGKTYLSVDGGANWREYLTDAGGQGGAFYVGNKLWKFDINLGLDGRSRA